MTQLLRPSMENRPRWLHFVPCAGPAISKGREEKLVQIGSSAYTSKRSIGFGWFTLTRSSTSLSFYLLHFLPALEGEAQVHGKRHVAGWISFFFVCCTFLRLEGKQPVDMCGMKGLRQFFRPKVSHYQEKGEGHAHHSHTHVT